MQMINECIDEQEKTGKPFGDILLSKGYCSKNDIETALIIDSRIGMILLNKDFINEKQLENALLEKMKNKDTLLGGIILQLGYITLEQLESAIEVHNRLRAT